MNLTSFIKRERFKLLGDLMKLSEISHRLSEQTIQNNMSFFNWTNLDQEFSSN